MKLARVTEHRSNPPLKLKVVNNQRVSTKYKIG